MEILFSIIIPTFNNVALLKKAIQSVINQENVSFEIIVVDDSTNNEIEDFMVQYVSGNIRYIHNHPNLGAVKNWNYGISLARGQYLIIMHHDECFKDTTKTLQSYLSHISLGNEVIVTEVEVIMNAHVLKRFSFLRCIKQKLLKGIPSLLYFYNFIGPVSCLCIKKELVTTFNEKLTWLVDVDFYYRLFVGTQQIFYCSSVVQSMHGHEGQISKNIDVLKRHKEDMRVLFSTSYKTFSQLFFIRLSYWYQYIKFLIKS